MKTKSTHDWISKLANESNVISSFQLDKSIPCSGLNDDAYNLANCDAHCRLIARASEALATASYATDAKTLLQNLITKNTYGAFSELAAYEWFSHCYVKFQPQVKMSETEVLSKNGSTLDGKILDGDIHFDIKSFGFNGQLAKRLKEKLQEHFQDDVVIIEGSWDLSSNDFESHIRNSSKIAASLKSTRTYQSNGMRIRLEKPRPVSTSIISNDPYFLAQENALYPYKYSKQFTLNHPFILMFIIHPWFNASTIHNDFGGKDSIFTRSLARRAFMQFTVDSTSANSVCNTVKNGVTLADASKLLSAIFFVNVWPKDADPSITYEMPSWLYLNPRATHPLSTRHLSHFRASNRNGIYIDDFSNDNY